MTPQLESSYRNFHAKGLDYLCLKRTPEHTVKVYFFDGDADLSALPEIVMPHDHRYNFDTTVIAGAAANLVQNRTGQAADAVRYHAFDWRTPLNGGDGFTYRAVEYLTPPEAHAYEAGQTWLSAAAQVHTLRILRPGTILMLDQWEDLLPRAAPTTTFVSARNDREPIQPSDAGLYDRMDADYARTLLARLVVALDA